MNGLGYPNKLPKIPFSLSLGATAPTRDSSCSDEFGTIIRSQRISSIFLDKEYLVSHAAGMCKEL